MIDDDKQAAAVAAVAEVRDGMLVGLGTGSTAAFAIRALGERVAAGLAVRAVVTSDASGKLARPDVIRSCGLPPGPSLLKPQTRRNPSWL